MPTVMLFSGQVFLAGLHPLLPGRQTPDRAGSVEVGAAIGGQRLKVQYHISESKKTGATSLPLPSEAGWAKDRAGEA